MAMEKHKLAQHQLEAIKAIRKAAKKHSRAQIVMACGTGKTLVGLQYAIKSKAKNILVLLPSLGLIKQTLEYWLTHSTNWDMSNFLCVCSDQTVAAYDDIQISKDELPCLVTTKTNEVKQFLKNRDSRDINIVFSTYQSANVVSEGMSKSFTFDLGVFDEAHKTAGTLGKCFGLALDDKKIKIGFRLFMTATPRHYKIRVQDDSDSRELTYSMNDIEKYGEVAYTFSFSEAVEQNIICDYRVIVSIITNKDIQRAALKNIKIKTENDLLESEKIAHRIALSHALQKHNIKKLITFHSTVKDAEDFTSNTIQLNDFNLSHVNGSMTSTSRHNIIDDFRNTKKGILTNARCLTEGVDVPIVDCVAFLHPKKSAIDIIQATGRAVRKADGKKYGYIFIPLYLDVNKNEKVEEAADRIDYEVIWSVLNALKETDSLLADILTAFQTNYGERKRFYINRLGKKIIFHTSPKITSQTLKKYIQTKCISKIVSIWDYRYGQLIAYKKKYGHCNISRTCKNFGELAIWLHSQKYSYKKGVLSSKKIVHLESIGVVWNVIEFLWLKNFEELKNYEKIHGHCNIPQIHVKNPKLGVWIGTQRKSYKKNKLAPEKILKLEEIGFSWDTKEIKWLDKLEELKDYKKIHGHCNVPKGYTNIPALAQWVSLQRQSFTNQPMPLDRIKKLESIGFIWKPYEAQWADRVNELKNYKKLHGHCNVPRKYAKNPGLANWIGTQRMAYKKGKLTPEQVQKLEEIGFVWRITKTA